MSSIPSIPDRFLGASTGEVASPDDRLDQSQCSVTAIAVKNLRKEPVGNGACSISAKKETQKSLELKKQQDKFRELLKAAKPWNELAKPLKTLAKKYLSASSENENYAGKAFDIADGLMQVYLYDNNIFKHLLPEGIQGELGFILWAVSNKEIYLQIQPRDLLLEIDIDKLIEYVQLLKNCYDKVNTQEDKLRQQKFKNLFDLMQDMASFLTKQGNREETTRKIIICLSQWMSGVLSGASIQEYQESYDAIDSLWQQLPDKGTLQQSMVWFNFTRECAEWWERSEDEEGYANAIRFYDEAGSFLKEKLDQCDQNPNSKQNQADSLYACWLKCRLDLCKLLNPERVEQVFQDSVCEKCLESLQKSNPHLPVLSRFNLQSMVIYLRQTGKLEGDKFEKILLICKEKWEKYSSKEKESFVDLIIQIFLCHSPDTILEGLNGALDEVHSQDNESLFSYLCKTLIHYAKKRDDLYDLLGDKVVEFILQEEEQLHNNRERIVDSPWYQELIEHLKQGQGRSENEILYGSLITLDQNTDFSGFSLIAASFYDRFTNQDSFEPRVVNPPEYSEYLFSQKNGKRFYNHAEELIDFILKQPLDQETEQAYLLMARSCLIIATLAKHPDAKDGLLVVTDRLDYKVPEKYIDALVRLYQDNNVFTGCRNAEEAADVAASILADIRIDRYGGDSQEEKDPFQDFSIAYQGKNYQSLSPEHPGYNKVNSNGEIVVQKIGTNSIITIPFEEFLRDYHSRDGGRMVVFKYASLGQEPRDGCLVLFDQFDVCQVVITQEDFFEELKQHFLNFGS